MAPAEYPGTGTMNNADFASLIAASGPPTENLAVKVAGERQNSGARATKRPKKRPRPHSDIMVSSKYRDRAKERRDDANPDYADAANQAVLDVEQSKFLGGDEHYTHLVKGLDLALLRKKRADAARSSTAPKDRATKRSSDDRGRHAVR